MEICNYLSGGGCFVNFFYVTFKVDLLKEIFLNKICGFKIIKNSFI